MIIIYILSFILFFMIIWHFSTLKWRDFYTLTFCFGRKGQASTRVITLSGGVQTMIYMPNSSPMAMSGALTWYQLIALEVLPY